MPLGFLATWAHCWLMFIWLSTTIPRSFSAGHLSSHSEVFAPSSLVGPPWSSVQYGFKYTLQAKRKDLRHVVKQSGCTLGTETQRCRCVLQCTSQYSRVDGQMLQIASYLQAQVFYLEKQECMEKLQIFVLKCSQGKYPGTRVA